MWPAPKVQLYSLEATEESIGGMTSQGGLCYVAPLGYLVSLCQLISRPRAAALFLMALGTVSYVFAQKMKRWLGMEWVMHVGKFNLLI